MQTIRLLKEAAGHAKGTLLRVWRDGEPKADMIDPARAEQWIADGIAKADAATTVAERVADKAEAAAAKKTAKKKATRKRGK